MTNPASQSVSDPVPMNGFSNAEYFDITSEATNETLRIFVSKPWFTEPDKTYPATYVLDGNLSFALAMQTYGSLALAGEAPAGFVIGIGYPTTEGFAGTIARRSRDYTPTPGGEIEAAATGATELGYAAPFQTFLSKQLQPEIERRYAVTPGDAGLAGTSLGGLFTTWSLLTAPTAFKRYIICSPSIWWDNEAVWQWEEDCSNQHDAIDARVFISAGGLETAELQRVAAVQMAAGNSAIKELVEASITMYDQHGWPKMAEITPTLTNRMQSRGYDGLEICCHNMPDETHVSNFPAAFCRGLRYVFGSWEPK